MAVGKRGTQEREMRLLVVRWLASFREGLQGLPEGSHTARNLSLFVLRDGELDVAEHELVV